MMKNGPKRLMKMLNSISSKEELDNAWVVVIGSETKPVQIGDDNTSDMKIHDHKVECNPLIAVLGRRDSVGVPMKQEPDSQSDSKGELIETSQRQDFGIEAFYDDIISSKFSRYDNDDSGTLNNQQELEQLTTNLVFDLSGKILQAGGNQEARKAYSVPPLTVVA